MATTTVNSLVQKAQTILQDTTEIRWPQDELVGWLNDAYKEIVNIRPDANSEAGTHSCTAGTRQNLRDSFASALRVLDVVKNVSSGKVVDHIDRRVLDDQRRSWHAETESADIEHWMFDPRIPYSFLVYPPASVSASLEVIYSSVPTDHDVDTDYSGNAETIKLVDSYANAILDYMLYRAYSKDADYAANAQRATAHYQAMQAALGAKTQSDTAANPRDAGEKTVR